MLIYLGSMANPSMPDTSHDQQQGLKPRGQTTTRIATLVFDCELSSSLNWFCPLNCKSQTH